MAEIVIFEKKGDEERKPKFLVKVIEERTDGVLVESSDYLSAGFGYYYLILKNTPNQRTRQALYEVDFLPIQDQRKPCIYVLKFVQKVEEVEDEK